MKSDISKSLNKHFQEYYTEIQPWYINRIGGGDTTVVKDLLTKKYLRVIYYKQKSGLYIITSNYDGKSHETRCFNNTLASNLDFYITECKKTFTKLSELPQKPQQMMFDFDTGNVVEQPVKF
jgi:hypothetical protein